MPGTEFELPCELVLLAMGFLGAERRGVVAELASSSTPGATWPATATGPPAIDRVFVCGDMTRGQSLIVWAIAEGRSAAAAVDRCLMGETALPAPVVRASWPCADRAAQHVTGHGAGEALVLVGGGDPPGGPLHLGSALPMAMLSPEWANMSTSLGMSPMVAISSVEIP